MRPDTCHPENKRFANSDGFTLVEAMVAMVVLAIGILSLYSMQTISIKFNASANAITNSSTWAADRIENLLAGDYEAATLTDTNGNGTAGLDQTGMAADGRAVSPDNRYTISWNITDYLNPNPAQSSFSTVKAIRVIVQHSDRGIAKQVTMNYYKQRTY